MKIYTSDKIETLIDKVSDPEMGFIDHCVKWQNVCIYDPEPIPGMSNLDWIIDTVADAFVFGADYATHTDDRICIIDRSQVYISPLSSAL